MYLESAISLNLPSFRRTLLAASEVLAAHEDLSRKKSEADVPVNDLNRARIKREQTAHRLVQISERIVKTEEQPGQQPGGQRKDRSHRSSSADP